MIMRSGALFLRKRFLEGGCQDYVFTQHHSPVRCRCKLGERVYLHFVVTRKQLPFAIVVNCAIAARTLQALMYKATLNLYFYACSFLFIFSPILSLVGDAH